MKLKKNNTSVVRLRYRVQEILGTLGILDGFKIMEKVPTGMLKNDLMVQSYLRGAFLA